MAYTTINKPTLYFDTRLYTGTGAENVVSDLGFSPDFVWFKKRSDAEHHFVYDQPRGALKKIAPSNTNAETTETQTLKSFGTNGYTLGTSAEVNGGSTTYAAWNWKAGTTSGLSGGTITPTSYSINTTSGFGIYKYTGNGSNATIAHGLGSTPRMVIVKNTTDANNWAIYYNPAQGINGQENRAIYFDTNGFRTSSTYWNGTAADSTVFNLGTTSIVNENAKGYVAYAFADVTGYQKFCGWYANANADGPFIYTGFKPAFFMMFNINNSGRWMMADSKRNPFNEKDKKLSPANTNAEATTSDIACDFLSNGIKIRGSSTSDINYGNLNMMYGLAIAAEPLVGSNDVAATGG